MRKILLVPTAAALGAAFLAGCGGGNNANYAAQNGAGKSYKIGYSQSTLQDPWRKAMNSELETEAKEHPNVQLLMQDAQNRATDQINQVENLLTQGMDALMISPIESGPLTPEVTKVFKQGIPVILLDRGVDNDQYTTLVGADNKLIGEKAGEYVVQNFPDGAKILEIAGIPDATATKERASGFRAGLKDTAKYKIVASQPGDYLRGKAISAFQTMLTANPDVDVVYAHNDEMALGAATVLKNAGKTGKVAVIGVDGQNEAIQAVADGEMAATFVYPRPGAEGLKAAVKVLNGETVEKRIILPTTQITKENASEWIGKGF